MKACQTSCRFRYSKDTSRLTCVDGGDKRMRRIRSVRVRYRPLTRKTRKERKEAAVCTVVMDCVILENMRARGDGCY